MEPLVHLWWLLEFRTSEENTRPHAVQKNMHETLEKLGWCAHCGRAERRCMVRTGSDSSGAIAQRKCGF